MTDDLNWGSRWRDAVVDAVSWDTHSVLHSFALAVLKKRPDRSTLRVSGLGNLLNDPYIWGKSSNPATGRVAAEALAKWNLHSTSSSERAKDLASSSETSKPPLAGLKAKVYSECVTLMQEWLLSVDEVLALAQTARRASISLVMHGFPDWRHLDGVLPSDVKR